MNISHFMLPTQAADAIILDGSILILVGVILSIYILYKNRSNLMDTSLLPALDIAGEENIHHQYEFEYNDNTQTDNEVFETAVENNNYNQSEESEEEFEEEYIKQEEGQKILIR